MTTFTGEDVLAERKRRGLSRRQMSELVGLSQGQIDNLEKGRTPPKQSVIDALQEFMSGATITPPTSNGFTAPAGEPVSTDIPILLIAIDEEEEDSSFNVLPDMPDQESITPVVTTPPASLLEPKAVPVAVGRLISNSEVQTYKRCKRKWWLGWYRHLRMKTETPVGARAIGTWVHTALEGWYVPDGQTRTDPREGLERVLLEVNTVVTQYATELANNSDDGGFAAEAMVQRFKKDADLSRAMVEGYVEWLAGTGADAGFEVIASETMLALPFDLQHDQDVFIVGKIDTRMRRAVDGFRFFMDHKTVGSIDRARKMLHMNEQMLHYRLLESLKLLQDGASDEEGVLVDGALYNMLRKVKRTANAKPPFYERVEVRHNNHEVYAYVQHLTSSANEMLATERKLRETAGQHHSLVPPSPRDDCTWSCDFYAVCPMFDDGSRVEDMLDIHYVKTEHLDYYGDSLIALSDEGTSD